MTTNDTARQAEALPPDADQSAPRGADPCDSAVLEGAVPSFEDVLATLPPEQRELAILASSGC